MEKHMQEVRIVNSSVGMQDSMIKEIAFAARVSNPANQINNERDEYLVRYLMRHNHWSPFEMVSVCLELKTTRDIARQVLRHRSFSFQEFSQRYASVDTDSFIFKEARLQDQKNRQNSIEISDPVLEADWLKAQTVLANHVSEAYTWALDNGIAKEVARVVLPEGLTPSTMYMNGTLRSWIHYIQLRTANGTQKEHMELALACAKAIKPIFPMIMEFTNGYDKEEVVRETEPREYSEGSRSAESGRLAAKSYKQKRGLRDIKHILQYFTSSKDS